MGEAEKENSERQQRLQRCVKLVDKGLTSLLRQVVKTPVRALPVREQRRVKHST